jgi:hypothetical protein
MKHTPIPILILFKKLILGMFYLYLPGFTDVLPTYVVLILLSPFVLIALKHNKLYWVLSISAVLWFIGQFEIPFAKILPEGTELGYPSVLAYQFLFISGIIFGYYTKNNQLKLEFPKKYFYVILFVFLLFLVLRHMSNIENILPYSLTSRWRFSLIRLLNFYVIAYLLYWLISKGYFFTNRFLEKIGQHSLYVFFFHVLVMTLLPYHLLEYINNNLGLYFITMAILISSLYIPAYIHEKYVEYQKKNLKKE